MVTYCRSGRPPTVRTDRTGPPDSIAPSTKEDETDDDDLVFKALADPTRRQLLDLLFEREGRTLAELVADLAALSDAAMTRFGVMKHLRVLEDAGLVIPQRSGREKRHYLNPVPIRLIHDRWIDKYTERQVTALADLKHQLEESS
jgi:DNA-binding transcriptional ArsR family regulator